jgi:nucleotide-binding universal stress UspA family protein
MTYIHKPVVIPWDFTEVSDYALAEAVLFAKISDSKITLLHIAKTEAQIPEAQSKLEEIAQEAEVKFQFRPDIMVCRGTIFETISKVVEDIDAQLLVMGTHGAKGLQKWLGSWALKVIIATKAPVVVVQQPPDREKLDTILMPYDWTEEQREKLRWIILICSFYRSKVLISYSKKLSPKQEEMMNLNLRIAEKYFSFKNIDFEINALDGKKSYTEETIDFAVARKVGLMVIMMPPNLTISDFAFGAEEQEIIANRAKIPVMCINPME